MTELEVKKTVLDKTLQIGLVYTVVQTIALLILSKGAIFLLPLALAEAPGWVALGLWVSHNFIIIAFFCRQLIEQFFKSKRLGVLMKLTVLPVIGGLSGFGLYLLYYRFHYYYIGADFEVSNFHQRFWNIVLTMIGLFMIAEIIEIFRRKRTTTNNRSGVPPSHYR